MAATEELIEAVDANDVVELQRLIEAGADVNGRDAQGRTCLMHAVAPLSNNVTLEVIELLVKNGADVNAHDDEQQWTALHLSARDQRLDVVRALIRYGAMVDATDIFGNTPLFRCISTTASPDRAVIAELLDHGADPTKKNRYGNSPQGLANKIGDLELQSILEKPHGEAGEHR